MLVDILTRVEDTTGLSDWLKENRPEHIHILEDGSVRLKCSHIKTRYKGNKSVSLIRTDASAIAEGDEETPRGWLLDTPFIIDATGRTRTENCPWLKLTEEQKAKWLEIVPYSQDEEGNDIISDVYKPFEFTG